ncbi:glycosyltransferase family 4 protein [Alistipes sp. ZOR0009]|uniref:glycosyltransferase family 4 protein n=1 Tax=Alistipes sp. ZOR0009 TaxID=1339253 RepID=UPI0006483077|nr:glycosyltransferase family 4 protein [Alistipes sp. ZOR0009]
MGKKKNILIVTPHFYPEDFKVNDIAFDLQKRGFGVSVVTCIPNYPQGKFFSGYSLFKKRREAINGVSVYRVAVIPRGNGSGVMLGLNYLSYLITATLTCLFLGLRHRYSHVFVHETSPVTVGLPAILVKKIQRIPLFFWVLDLWPESIVAASGLKNKFILNKIDRLVKFIYRSSNLILISSKGFQKSILEKGDFRDKIVYFPNWAEDIFVKPIGNVELPSFPKGFNVMFAGNIGEAQNFEVVMQAALLTKRHKDIHYCIVGDGRKRSWVEEFVKRNELEDTVHLYGRYPISHMPAFFDKADVMLLPLKDEPIFALTVPAKLQAYMASSKAVVGLIAGEGANIISEAKCGFCVEPSNFEKLAEVILQASILSKDELKTMGNNGRIYYDSTFMKDSLLSKLEQLFL